MRNSNETYILEALSLYTCLKRPVTVEELWNSFSVVRRPPYTVFVSIIEKFASQKLILKHDKFLAASFGDSEAIFSKRADQDLILERKWKELLKSTHLFNRVPFANFAIIGGSMALGNVHEHSDFDVTLGCARGRIFTARFFTVLVFSLFKKRRKKEDKGIKASGKFCFNHFVTNSNLALRPPCHIYWEILYQMSVPVFGEKSQIDAFFTANNVKRENQAFYKKIKPKPSLFKTILEKVLSGKFGSFFEKLVKYLQVLRLKKTAKKLNPLESRFFVSDEELELHLNMNTINAIDKCLKPLQ